MRQNSKLILKPAPLHKINSIYQLEKKVWQNNAATYAMLEQRLLLFKQGNIIAKFDHHVIGYLSLLRTTASKLNKCKTWYEYTDNGYIKNMFDKNGGVLFGINLSVDPNYTRFGVGSALCEQAMRLARELNVKSVIFGSRIPEYSRNQHLTVEDYIKRLDGRGDYLLKFYRRYNLKLIKIQPNYFNDQESNHVGVILEWRNPWHKI